MIKQTKAALAEAKAELDRLSLLQCLAQRRYEEALEAYDRACLDAAATKKAVRKVNSAHPRFIHNRAINTLLSRCEREAIRLRIEGKTLSQIDKALGTGKRSTANLFIRAKEKFGLETNGQLMEFVRQTGLV